MEATKEKGKKEIMCKRRTRPEVRKKKHTQKEKHTGALQLSESSANSAAVEEEVWYPGDAPQDKAFGVYSNVRTSCFGEGETTEGLWGDLPGPDDIIGYLQVISTKFNNHQPSVVTSQIEKLLHYKVSRPRRIKPRHRQKINPMLRIYSRIQSLPLVGPRG